MFTNGLTLTYCAAAILDGSPMRPPAFISTEEGVSPTTIIITPRIFTGFSHGLVCYKRQRFSYDTMIKIYDILRLRYMTGRCHKLKNTCFHAKRLCIMLFNKHIW